MRREVERFYVVEFKDFRRVFVATFRQQHVGAHTVEVYVRGSLHRWIDLPKDSRGSGHPWSIFDLFYLER